MYIFGYFFQKRHFKGIWEKGHIDKKRWGGGGGGLAGDPTAPPGTGGHVEHALTLYWRYNFTKQNEIICKVEISTTNNPTIKAL